SSFNQIGTNGDGIFDDVERNIISGNTQFGVQLDSDPANPAVANVVAGNYIGTNASGTAAVPNLLAGVFLAVDSMTPVGTDGNGIADDAEGNVISGNRGPGIMFGAAHDGLVAGNRIGLDATGAALGNGTAGILAGLSDVNNQIGGPGALANSIAF